MKTRFEKTGLERTFIFLFRLMILSLPLYLILWFGISLLPFQKLVAFQSKEFLQAIGYSVVMEGTRLEVGKNNPFIFFIDEDCTGWKSMLFLFALIFAVPEIKLRKRILGLIFGLPMVWVFNLFRVIGTVLIERAYGMDIAMIAHDYGWRIGLIGIVLGIWVFWMKKF